MAERNADDPSDAVFLDSLTPSGGVDDVELDPAELEGGTSEGRGERERERGDQHPRERKRDLESENHNLRKALQDARSRGRRLREQAAQERARRDEETRRATAERNGGMRAEDAERLKNAEGDLAEAAPVLLDMADRRSQGHFLDLKRSIAVVSQGLARNRHTDYDDVLEGSGLTELLALDANGRPKDPDLWERIYLRSDDPGEDAYAIALDLLEEKQGREPRRGDGYEELPPATGSRAEGRREVMRQFEATTTRPRGIRDLPAASGPTRRRLTLNDIDKMTREERSRLPEHILAAWLGKPPD